MNFSEINREYFGGSNDKKRRAINIHSERTFEVNGFLFVVSRNLSLLSKCFEIYFLPKNYRGLLPKVLVEGKDSFGDYLSWNKALPIAFNSIENFVNNGLKNHESK